MSATNKTATYDLPLFVPTDKPTFLCDFNNAMTLIDTSLTTVSGQAATVINTANTALSIANAANTNVNSATADAATAVSLANTAKTTADTASAAASNATTTANNANTKADTATSTANAANTTANAASTAVAGIVTDPPAVYGYSRVVTPETSLPASSGPIDMIDVGTFAGMTWVSASKGYRVDKAGVYAISVSGMAKAIDYDAGYVNIEMLRAGVPSSLRDVFIPSYGAGGQNRTFSASIVFKLQVNDVITLYGQKSTIIGGTGNAGATTLYVYRIGA